MNIKSAPGIGRQCHPLDDTSLQCPQGNGRQCHLMDDTSFHGLAAEAEV